jgi:hypothetical protein
LLRVQRFSYPEKTKVNSWLPHSVAEKFRRGTRGNQFFALNQRNPTRTKFGSTPKPSIYGWSPVDGTFPVKEMTFGSFAVSTLERGKISRGASGEAMTHRGGSAMSPFV